MPAPSLAPWNFLRVNDYIADVRKSSHVIVELGGPIWGAGTTYHSAAREAHATLCVYVALHAKRDEKLRYSSRIDRECMHLFRPNPEEGQLGDMVQAIASEQLSALLDERGGDVPYGLVWMIPHDRGTARLACITRHECEKLRDQRRLL